MIMDDNDGQMIFGDLGGLKLPDICLTGEEKIPKKPHPRNLSRPGIEPGPAAWQTHMLPFVPQRWTRDKGRSTNLVYLFLAEVQSSHRLTAQYITVLQYFQQTHLLQFLHKMFKYFISKPNALGTFLNLHIKINIFRKSCSSCTSLGALWKNDESVFLQCARTMQRKFHIYGY